jgi:replicative superfamily II helicase
MVDFKKKLGRTEQERKIDPIEIYKGLDRRSETGPLRPGQDEILKTWFALRREDKDLIIKLHTGEGKTLIGLLILLSKLNLNHGPALYICPNKYLVLQVCEEAEKFGIPYCTIEDDDNDIPNDFLEGKKVLVTHIQKVFNGKSIFGTGLKYVQVKSIVLDDSHACIDSIKNSFTIRLERKHSAYKLFVDLFDNDLVEQGEGTWMEIKDGDYDSMLPIPYWSWFDKKSEILRVLSEHKEDLEIRFVWPIIKDKIENCQAFISGNHIEISPYFVPVHMFSSFNKAEQRILMSATTQDDSFFIKGLNFEIDAIRNPLVNSASLWSGEKMIIAPSIIHDELTRVKIVNLLAKQREKAKFGIVALVPSFDKGNYYHERGAKVATPKTIFSDVQFLKNKNFQETLVIVNRYDGIDLPDDACRILILDSLPVSHTLVDRYEEMCRENSEILSVKVAQKIEQGLGRSVRGEKDFSAILLIGADLVKFVKSNLTNKFFSQQTRKQVDIGIGISKDAQEEVDSDDNTRDPNQTLVVLAKLINQCINRDEGWKEYYTAEMNQLIVQAPKEDLYPILKLEQVAENQYYTGNVDAACIAMQEIVDLFNTEESKEEKGWYMQLLARYKYTHSKMEANKMQETAFNLNSHLLKPIKVITYKKKEFIDGQRNKRLKDFLKRFESYADLKLEVDNLLNNLSFGIRAEVFEKTLNLVGELLGFVCQRPDKEIKKGPDNIWGGVSNNYFLFECKSEVREDREAITKHEANQMNGHCAWFVNEYGADAKVLNILVIETKHLSYDGDFGYPVVVMRKQGLRNLKNNIKSFIDELHAYKLSDVEDEALRKFLSYHKLMPGDIVSYTENVTHVKKVKS